MLNDITFCNGIWRIVYCALGVNDYDVFAFTFQLDNSSANQIGDLIALVRGFNLHRGIENSLVSKLQYALAALSVSDTATACDSLTSFINECLAQSGKKLTAGQADQLILAAGQIRSALGCQ